MNPFLLAADNSPSLMPLLRESPELVSKQDESGYSLLHAAASYNHLGVMRSLKELGIDPNIKDEDGETALFVVETVEAAQCLIEEVKTDPAIKNFEGMTAVEKIRSEGDFVAVADFLQQTPGTHPPPVPPGIQLQIGSLQDESSLGEVENTELRQRIEELASREDFHGEEGQNQLRDLITDAVRGINERDVRRRVDE